jgi:nucleoside-diphosphate-sugar epimerase
VTGALGQIGSELTPELREMYGKENVIASDLRFLSTDEGPFEILDVTDRKRLEEIVIEYDIEAIIHLAAILSASGELNPQLAWHVNMSGLFNVLEVARIHSLKQVFNPSSIAVFGSSTPKDFTPQETMMNPTTIYGITKLAGEFLGNYYYKKFGLDVRGIRFPGVISNIAPPGGGTTDYAIEMFYDVIKKGNYTSFLSEDTRLPMIYMPDCIKSVKDLMNAELNKLRHHTDFNLAAFSFTPIELADEIKKYFLDFKVDYVPDSRQVIADSWPRSINDSAARIEWSWNPSYDFHSMVEDMLKVLSERHALGKL